MISAARSFFFRFWGVLGYLGHFQTLWLTSLILELGGSRGFFRFWGIFGYLGYFQTLLAHLFDCGIWRLPRALSWILLHVSLGPGGIGSSSSLDSKFKTNTFGSLINWAKYVKCRQLHFKIQKNTFYQLIHPCLQEPINWALQKLFTPPISLRLIEISLP